VVFSPIRRLLSAGSGYSAAFEAVIPALKTLAKSIPIRGKVSFMLIPAHLGY
jgi:hypothetical protein